MLSQLRFVAGAKVGRRKLVQRDDYLFFFDDWLRSMELMMGMSFNGKAVLRGFACKVDGGGFEVGSKAVGMGS